MYAHYPETTTDKQVEFETLQASSVCWTMVRLPMIDPTDDRVEIKADLHDCPGDKISATSLAYFLIEQLAGKTWQREAPFIANS